MNRSQETPGKKEVRNKNEKKRKEKVQKRAQKKEGKKRSFDDMIAYVDQFGMITSAPPDPEKRVIVAAGSIEPGATSNKSESSHDQVRKGVITFFNESKGYGFIRDITGNDRIFVHASNLLEPVKENNIVVFETGKGPKGTTALNVKLFRE